MIDDDFNIDFGNIELPDLDLDLFAGPGDDARPAHGNAIHETVPPRHLPSGRYPLRKRPHPGTAPNPRERTKGEHYCFRRLHLWRLHRSLHHAPHGQSKEDDQYPPSPSRKENIDSLQNLLDNGYLDHLDLIISAYFYAHERHGPRALPLRTPRPPEPLPALRLRNTHENSAL